MTSATLFREGPDLDELLAELDAEHGGRVHVTDVEYGRDGGMLGFFARRTVGVHYVLTDDVPVAAPAPAGFAPAEYDSPLEAMLRAAEEAEASDLAGVPVLAAAPVVPAMSLGAAEAIVSSGRVDGAAGAAVVGDNVEFAKMLLEIAAQKNAERQDRTPSVTHFPSVTVPSVPSVLSVPSAPVIETPAAPVIETQLASSVVAPLADPDTARAALLARARTRPVGAHRAADPVPAAPAPHPELLSPPRPLTGGGDNKSHENTSHENTSQERTVEDTITTPVRTPLTLRRQLTEIGVPLAWLDGCEGSAFEVIEQVTRRVPVAGRSELDPGQLLVVAGPAVQARAEAERLCTLLRLDPAAIRSAGCGTDPIRNRRQAASLELDVRGTRGEPCVVVVATDSSGDTGGVSDLAWAADIVAALAPDQLVLVVDATSRAADIRRTATALGRVTSLAVVAAARSASPAALWELDVPVLSLDAAPATRGRWAALLIDRLTDLDGA